MVRRSMILAAAAASIAASMAVMPAVAADPSPAPDAAASPAAAPTSLLGTRYCEIIPTSVEGGTATSHVYNTLGFNDCPQEQWAALTEDAVNEAYGSQVSSLNGPRFWTLDAIQATGGATTSGETFTFGGIEMGLRAVLETPATQTQMGDQLYAPTEVQRQTVFVFLPGTTVYELTDPDGNVYMMQSYTTMKDPTLTLDQLADLGSRLDLPEGWSYQAVTLTEQYNLVADGIAYVVNDELLNSYQRQ